MYVLHKKRDFHHNVMIVITITSLACKKILVLNFAPLCSKKTINERQLVLLKIMGELSMLCAKPEEC